MQKKTRKPKKAGTLYIWNLLGKKTILLVVFATGACVLVIEVVATRILSPYFGNTIYSVSSIIGVVLAALSFGYYLGGKYADRNPSEKNFYSIIFYSGVATLVLEFLTVFLLPKIAYVLPVISGPLIASLILFTVPSFLLGMLSPYAIKLQEIKFPKTGIGNLSGEVFFYSTLGSISGSLATGFFLIPNFGINSIVTGVGIFLSFLGIAGLSASSLKKNRKSGIKSFLVKLSLVFFLLFLIDSLKSTSEKRFIYSDDGVYEKIGVYDTKYKGKSARLLTQDAGISSGILLDSSEMAFTYTKYYKLYKVFGVNVKNALFLGGGAYSTPYVLIKELSDVNVDVVEIEPSLYDVAKKYFGVKDNSRMNNIIADGRRYINDTDKKYDLIFADAYSSIFSVPVHMTTLEFFTKAHDVLNPGGIFIANIIGDLSRGETSLIFSEMKTFNRVFETSYYFAVEDPALTTPQNLIFVGLKKDDKTDFNNDNFTKSGDDIISTLHKKKIDLSRFSLEHYPVITDNYAPIESLSAGVLRKNYRKKNHFFDASESYQLIKQQVGLGPRYVGSQGQQRIISMLISELNSITDAVVTQTWQLKGKQNDLSLVNVVGRLNPMAEKRIILATHFDTKKYADKDNKNPKSYVPGANDGASGVAVLIELARSLKFYVGNPNLGYDFVFFDGEEGDPEAAYGEWKPFGSEYFAKNIKTLYPKKLPELAIVLDMVCDKDLFISKERNSSNTGGNFVRNFFKQATASYPQNFHDEIKVSVEDDHIALAAAGIPSFLLIDFEYPYFHTTKDTPDKCSEESLEKVGNVLLEYLNSL